MFEFIELLSDLIFNLGSINSTHRTEEESSKINLSRLFIIISVILSAVVLFLSSNIFLHEKIVLIIISIIGLSIIFNIALIFLLIQFKIIEPTTFRAFINYLIGLVLLTSSFGLFIIDYYNLTSN